MKISVIIPTYNEEKTISDCIKSLVKQDYKELEIIVVDDGSVDKTIEVLRNLQLTINNLQILKQQHKGPGAARNFGAKKATGEILVFVDADMTFEPDFMEKLIKPIIASKTKGTFSKEEYVSNWDNVWAKCWNINEGWIPERRHPKNYPDKQKVFRAILKSEFNKVGGFDSQKGYIDDWTLAKKLGYEAVAAPRAKFYHCNPDSLTEVFKQARWIGKRPYKLGLLGAFWGLLRASLLVSIVVGLIKAIFNRKLAFLIFKIIYDLGIFIGILEYLMIGKVSK